MFSIIDNVTLNESIPQPLATIFPTWLIVTTAILNNESLQKSHWKIYSCLKVKTSWASKRIMTYHLSIHKFPHEFCQPFTMHGTSSHYINTFPFLWISLVLGLGVEHSRLQYALGSLFECGRMWVNNTRMIPSETLTLFERNDVLVMKINYCITKAPEIITPSRS